MDDGEFLQYLQAKPYTEDFFPWQYPMPDQVGTSTTPRWNQIVVDAMEDYVRAQLLRDQELAEFEESEMREDVNRLIHDQEFAREILNIPEDEWNKTGDYFQRPYVETDGSFRVYCKGLVRNTVQLGGDAMKMTLAGIGAVICDTNDRQILKLQKPLEFADIVDGDSDHDCVEFKALIEGLDAALTLGLDRIHVLFDNKFLYQSVSGKGSPRTNKILTLVDQVSVLQKKFASCVVSLAEEKEDWFAFKLARDAIVSQATQHGNILIENCAICAEDTDVRKLFSIDYCLHEYCFSCMEKHVEAKLHQGMLPECPHEGCKTEMKLLSCKTFLTPELYGIMRKMSKEVSIPFREKIYCPYPACSALMSRRQVIDQYAVHSSPDAQQEGARKCMTCHGFFCISCKVSWHVNMTCVKYKKKNPHLSKEDAKLKTLAKKSRWRQCGKCSHMVELVRGCYHIYCRCGSEFCYTCGAEWKNKKATCKCPIWNERNIVYAERNGHPQ